MKTVLATCASRGRPNCLREMLDSFIKTSTHAHLAVRLDDDQADMYDDVRQRYDDRVLWFSGNRIGHCPSIVELSNKLFGYEGYGLATDDCLFLTQGWDDWAIKTARSFPEGIGAFAPFFGLYGRMDFPWVTNGWINAIGYIPNDSKFYYFDIVTQILAEQIDRLALAREDEFAMSHLSVLGEEGSTNHEKDANDKTMAAFIDGRNTAYWLQDGRRNALGKLREAMCASAS